MNVVLYGATGRVGSRILAELTLRGHQVVAVSRDPSKLPSTVTAVKGDLSDADVIANTIDDSDAVISAYGPPPNNTGELTDVTDRLIAAIKKTGGVRLLVVGGAGSLEVAPGLSLLASGQLPTRYVPIAKSHETVLQLLQTSTINWTCLSPAALFEPGERTGKFRLGINELITDSRGESRISMEDYAIALVDELERPKHERERFSVGY